MTPMDKPPYDPPSQRAPQRPAGKRMTDRDQQDLLDRIGALRATVTERLAGDLIQIPRLADQLVKQIDDLFASSPEADAKAPPPPGKGLAELVGVGPDAAQELGETRVPQGVEPYDETVTSERIVA